MKKFLLIIVLFIVTAEAAETMSNQSQHNIGSTQEKQRLLKAIEDCHIHGLEGKHNSRICLLKMMFLRPDLMGRLPKGANVMMLHGPTGTGKTRTAYGIAAEAKEEIQEEIPVIRIDCGVVEGTHVNEGSKYLEPIFANIEEKLQDGLKVILLVDEVDNIAGKEKHNPERNQTATTFWSFCEKHDDNPNLLIITTTNRLDSIYPQVKRRIGDNIISMPGPDFNGRMAILKFHAAKLNITLTDNEIKTLAQKTDGLGGGSLEKLVIALYFAKIQEKTLSNVDIDKIINILKDGEKDNSDKKDEKQEGWGQWIWNTTVQASSIAANIANAAYRIHQIREQTKS